MSKWLVYSTALCPPTIMLEHAHTGVYGAVRDFTSAEWQRAFYAPDDPYEWDGSDERIITKGDSE